MTMGEKKPNRGCLKTGAIIVLIFGTLILAVLAGAFASTDLGSAASVYEVNRNAAKKAGLFFTDAEIEEHFKVPDADNGMTLLAKLDEKPIGSPDDLTDAEIRERKVVIDAATNLFAEVSKKKFLISKKHGMFVPFGDSAKEKFGVKLLCRMAKYSSDQSDLIACQGYFHSAAHLANAADDEGGAIPILVRVACAAIVEARLKRLIANHGNDPAWLSLIEATLKELDQPYDLVTMLKLDHRERLQVSIDIKKEPMTLEQMRSNEFFPLSMRLGYYLPRYKEASLSRTHEYYSGLANQLPSDPYDWVQMQRAVAFSNAYTARKGWSYEAMMEPEFDQLPQAVWKEISNRNALFQAVAILKTHADPAKGLPIPGRYRLDRDGKPIRIKHLEKGWVVYSLFDRDDDGGQELVNGKGDFVVHLSAATVPPEIQPRGQKAIGIGAGSPSAP
jgi:hypothetical protein